MIDEWPFNRGHFFIKYLSAGWHGFGITALWSGKVPGTLQAEAGLSCRHESEHVMTLTGALGGAAVAKPRFDLQHAANIRTSFSNFRTFALVSQTLEDTGVACVYRELHPH